MNSDTKKLATLSYVVFRQMWGVRSCSFRKINCSRNTILCFVGLIMIMKSTVFADNIMNLHHLGLGKYILDCLKVHRYSFTEFSDRIV